MYRAQIKNLMIRGAAVLAVQACLLAVLAALRSTPPEGPLAFLTSPAQAKPKNAISATAKPPTDEILGDVLPSLGVTKFVSSLVPAK